MHSSGDDFFLEAKQYMLSKFANFYAFRHALVTQDLFYNPLCSTDRCACV